MNKERYYHKLETIKESGNYRILREIEHNGFLIHDDGREMLICLRTIIWAYRLIHA